MMGHRLYFANQVRWRGWEFAFWLAWVVAYFVPQSNLALLSQILIWGLFAVSLDLLLGYRGLSSFGQAAFTPVMKSRTSPFRDSAWRGSSSAAPST